MVVVVVVSVVVSIVVAAASMFKHQKFHLCKQKFGHSRFISIKIHKKNKVFLNSIFGGGMYSSKKLKSDIGKKTLALFPI